MRRHRKVPTQDEFVAQRRHAARYADRSSHEMAEEVERREWLRERKKRQGPRQPLDEYE